MRQISPRQLEQLLAEQQPVYLVDVRQPWEHERARLADQVLIPLDELMERTAEVTPPESALVVVYCHHGVRSLSAAAILEHAGFANVASLTGGIDRWSLEIDPKIPRY
jgi:adenylyltransferase/sulfurtransferase